MTESLDAPRGVIDIVRRLESEGFETWAVGGAVRDGVRGQARADWDLATRARPDQVKKLFRRTVPLGVDHGTVGVFGADGVLYEVTTFRLDVLPLGRRAVVSFADTIDEDLARRDFTVNAMAWHPIRGSFHDPYHGLDDLNAGVLRAVGDPGERFREDYLRVLRGLRFAGEFDLSVEARTWESLVAGVEGLSVLSPERVREELMKVLAGQVPSRALALYERAGVRAALYPGLVKPLHAPARAAIDAVRPHRPILRVGLMLLHGLEEVSPGAAEGFGTALRFSNQDVRRLERMMEGGTAPPEGGWAEAAGRRQWMSGVGRDHLRDTLRIWLAGLRGSQAVDPHVLEIARITRRELALRIPLTTAELPVSGRDLKAWGMEPGPEMGELLRDLLEFVWERPELARRDRLTPVARERLEAQMR